MPDTLSSDELGDLLAAVDDGELTADQPQTFHRNKAVAPYDFLRPTRLSRVQARQLQRLYESALEELTRMLSESLHTPMEANVLGVKAVTYGSFTNVLPTPTYVNIFEIEPFGYRGLLTMEIPFGLALVDRLLGGHGHTTEKPRNLTAIEMSILEWPVKMILEQLQGCWHSSPEIRFVGESVRMDLNFSQIMHTAESILRVTFALGGEIGSGEVHFCVPFAALERSNCLADLHNEALGASGPRNEEETARARENLRKVCLSVSAQLGATKLTVREIIGLDVGQVITLDSKVDRPIPVKVGEKVKFLAKPGLRSKSLAIQIQEVLESS